MQSEKDAFHPLTLRPLLIIERNEANINIIFKEAPYKIQMLNGIIVIFIAPEKKFTSKLNNLFE